MLGFVVVAGAIFGLIHLYLWWRLVRTTTRPGRWRRAGTVGVLVLALLVPVSFFGSELVHGLAWPGFVWLGLMFYLVVVLIVIELPMLALRLLLLRRRAPAHAAALVGAPAAKEDSGTDGQAADPDRRLLLARGAAIFAGLTAAGVTGYGVRNATARPRLRRVEIPLSRLNQNADGYRIALVADVHLGPLRGPAQTARIVEMINQADPDLVAVVGDLANGSVAELGGGAAPLRGLRSRDGSYFVTGNHEYDVSHQDWVEHVADLGLRPLRNERVELAGFDLAGVNDVTGEEHDDGPDYDRALAGRDPTRAVVLLAHQPVQVHEAARRGVDLQLSGHTHGGQMFPYHLWVRLEQPVLSGRHRFGDTELYVTNGVGSWGPPVRVAAPSDITLVELIAA